APTAGSGGQQPGGGSISTGGGTTGSNAAADKTPPTVTLILVKQRLGRALRKGYLLFFRSNETGAGDGALFARSLISKRVKVASGHVTVTKAGKVRLVLKFTKKARRAFAKRRKVKLTLVLTVKDAAG